MAPTVTIASNFIFIKIADVVLGKIVKYTWVRDLVETINWHWATGGRRVLLNIGASSTTAWKTESTGAADPAAPTDLAATHKIIVKNVFLSQGRVNLDVHVSGANMELHILLTDTVGGALEEYRVAVVSGSATTTMTVPVTDAGPGNSPQIIIEVRLGKSTGVGTQGELHSLRILEDVLVTAEFVESP